MGEFIGGTGAAFIMAAAVAVIVKFLMEINVIKDRESAVKSAKISLITIIAGIVYVTATVIMYNEFKGQTNYFNFEKIFDFMGIGDTLSLCKNPELVGLFTGMRMPLYPIAVHAIGKLIFEKYTLTAQFISFVSSCITSCMLYALIERKSEKITDFMLLFASVPYVFMLFTPTYISLDIALAVSAVYALAKGKRTRYFILALLAVLAGKIGIIAFTAYPLMKYADSFVSFVESKIFGNGIVFRVIITLFILFNGAALCVLTRGI